MSELDPKDWSDQRMVHGLLKALAERENGAAQERLSRTLAQLAVNPVPAGRSVRRASLVALVACLPVLFAVGLFTLRGESAHALVRASAHAERALDKARFLVTAFAKNTADEEALILRGSMDSSADQLARFHGARPDGSSGLSLGRTERGNWIQIGTASATWFPAGAPQNEALDHPTTMLGSVDTFLDTLANNYELELLEPETGFSGSRVMATRAKPHGFHPQRVVLWIAQPTHRVQRIELHWLEAAPLTLADLHTGLAAALEPATWLISLPRLLTDSNQRLSRMVMEQAEPLDLTAGDFLPAER